MAYRVIQWGTGFVGKMALRATIEHPDLELVGLVVHGKDKVGRDAGELIGLPPAGVVATDDVQAAERIPADVVSYFANADLRPADAVQDMARMLAAGKNVRLALPSKHLSRLGRFRPRSLRSPSERGTPVALCVPTGRPDATDDRDDPRKD